MMSSILKIPFLRLKYKYLPSNAQKFWAQELLNSQGLTAKIGQVLAQGKETELPKPTIKTNEALKIFKVLFKKDVQVENEILAASMGQVFFVSVDGNEYALKLLHPGIRKKLEKEISNILILGTHFAKSKGFSFDKSVFNRFLVELFDEETNLKREGEFQTRFRNIFESDQRFSIPKVFPEYSTEEALCQEVIRTEHARDLKTFPNHDIFHFYFASLLNHGLLHGDLNDRNWGMKDNRTVIYDFGCSQIVSSRRTEGLKKLLRNENVVEAFKEFGIRLEATYFKGKEQELRDALFNPLLGTINPEWNYTQVLKSEFGEHIKSLREFTDPWVLLMMRSLFSLIKIYQHRKMEIPLGEILLPYLKKEKTSTRATQIRIQVMEDSAQVVFMSLPISELPNLEALMPSKVSSKMEIDISQIVKKVESSNYAPQVLYEMAIDERRYKIWID